MNKKKSGSKKGKKGDARGAGFPPPPAQRKGVTVKLLGDWRAETLAQIRALIQEADPEAVEEVKWRKPSNPAGVPVWSHDGIICTGETYKDKVKITFAKGASLADPSGLFNSSLEAGTRRAIDFHEGDKIDERALKTLIRAAVLQNTAALNASAGSGDPRRAQAPAAARPARLRKKPKSA